MQTLKTAAALVSLALPSGASANLDFTNDAPERAPAPRRISTVEEFDHVVARTSRVHKTLEVLVGQKDKSLLSAEQLAKAQLLLEQFNGAKTHEQREQALNQAASSQILAQALHTYISQSVAPWSPVFSSAHSLSFRFSYSDVTARLDADSNIVSLKVANRFDIHFQTPVTVTDSAQLLNRCFFMYFCEGGSCFIDTLYYLKPRRVDVTKIEGNYFDCVVTSPHEDKLEITVSNSGVFKVLSEVSQPINEAETGKLELRLASAFAEREKVYEAISKQEDGRLVRSALESGEPAERLLGQSWVKDESKELLKKYVFFSRTHKMISAQLQETHLTSEYREVVPIRGSRAIYREFTKVAGQLNLYAYDNNSIAGYGVPSIAFTQYQPIDGICKKVLTGLDLTLYANRYYVDDGYGSKLAPQQASFIVQGLLDLINDPSKSLSDTERGVCLRIISLYAYEYDPGVILKIKDADKALQFLVKDLADHPNLPLHEKCLFAFGFEQSNKALKEGLKSEDPKVRIACAALTSYSKPYGINFECEDILLANKNNPLLLDILVTGHEYGRHALFLDALAGKVIDPKISASVRSALLQALTNHDNIDKSDKALLTLFELAISTCDPGLNTENFQARTFGIFRAEEKLANLWVKDRTTFVRLAAQALARQPFATSAEWLTFRLAGIEFPSRYSSEARHIIVQGYKESTWKSTSPVLFYVTPKSDYNGAFSSAGETILTFSKNGYQVRLIESGDDVDCVQRLLHVAGVGTSRHRSADTIIFGAHSQQDGMAFRSLSSNNSERIDLQDERWLIALGLGKTLKRGGQIIIEGCSTGKGKAKENNVANMLSRIFPHASVIHSPTVPSSIKQLEFKDGKLRTVRYNAAEDEHYQIARP